MKDSHNRGIRDHHGDLWEVELGRHGHESTRQDMDGKVVFCRKPDGFAFSVVIPSGQTLADYDDETLVGMIDDRLSGPSEQERRVG